MMLDELRAKFGGQNAGTKGEYFLSELHVEPKSNDVCGPEEMRWIDEIDVSVWQFVAEWTDGDIWIKGEGTEDFQLIEFKDGRFKVKYGGVIYGDVCEHVLKEFGGKMPKQLKRDFEFWLKKRKLLDGV
jgi:hypothetical protein